MIEGLSPHSSHHAANGANNTNCPKQRLQRHLFSIIFHQIAVYSTLHIIYLFSLYMLSCFASLFSSSATHMLRSCATQR